MKTRVIVLLLVAALTMGLTASAAAEGNSWPAVVIKDPSSNWCDTAWLAADGTGFLALPVTHQTVVLSGQDRVLVKNCFAFVDFSDPQYMPWEEACNIFGCQGNVLTFKFTWDWCDEDGYCFASSQPGRVVVHKSGEMLMTYTTVWR